MERSCKGCKYNLGGGYNNCRINLENECAAGDYEAWEPDVNELGSELVPVVRTGGEAGITDRIQSCRMPDREKVIKGLECCTGYCDEETGCPYYDPDNEEAFACEEHLRRDAIALLKAQEPHVVTIADYNDNPNVDKDDNLPVWRESRVFPGIAHHVDGWVVLNRNRVEEWFNSEAIRFWTSRPTDAQREAEPWN